MKYQRYRRGTLVDTKNIVVGHHYGRQPVEGMVVRTHPSVVHPRMQVLAQVARIDKLNHYLYVVEARDE